MRIIQPEHVKKYVFLERFVVDRLLEMVYHKTLDTYRVRSLNSFLLAVELKETIFDFKINKIKHYKPTITSIIEELRTSLDNKWSEKIFDFSPLSKSTFLKLLKDASEGDGEKYILKVEHAAKIFIKQNVGYTEKCLQKVGELVDKKNSYDAETDYWLIFDEIDWLLTTLASGLLGYGFSRAYLNNVINSLSKFQPSFKDFFEQFSNICLRDAEEFTIIIGVRVDVKLNNVKEYLLGDEEKSSLAKLNNFSLTFFSRNEKYQFLKFRVKAKDYISAVKEAREDFGLFLDILNLGYNSPNLFYHSSALVVGDNKPEKANQVKIWSSIDDTYLKEHAFYLEIIEVLEKSRLHFVEKIKNPEAHQRIISGVRYLRLGDESKELHQRFVNYWIGLEYLYSTYQNNSSTIDRLKEFIVSSHKNIYISRNTHEFYEDLKRTTPDENIDVTELSSKELYDKIEGKIKTNPLLAWRAHKTKLRLFKEKGDFNKENTKALLEFHGKNLSWHLTRCYRIRNEIVHDAAIKTNIESITSNIRYYLAFSLSSILHFIKDNEYIELNSLEDYFTSQSLFSINDCNSVEQVLSKKPPKVLFS